jgi:hypothetical protein
MNYSSKVDEYNKQVHGIEKKDYSELVERLVTLKWRCSCGNSRPRLSSRAKLGSVVWCGHSCPRNLTTSKPAGMGLGPVHAE